jgi:hypothetical protein
MRQATRLMGAGLPVLIAIAVGFPVIGLELVATGQDVRQQRGNLPLGVLPSVVYMHHQR